MTPSPPFLHLPYFHTVLILPSVELSSLSLLPSFSDIANPLIYPSFLFFFPLLFPDFPNTDLPFFSCLLSISYLLFSFSPTFPSLFLSPFYRLSFSSFPSPYSLIIYSNLCHLHSFLISFLLSLFTSLPFLLLTPFTSPLRLLLYFILLFSFLFLFIPHSFLLLSFSESSPPPLILYLSHRFPSVLYSSFFSLPSFSCFPPLLNLSPFPIFYAPPLSSASYLPYIIAGVIVTGDKFLPVSLTPVISDYVQ